MSSFQKSFNKSNKEAGFLHIHRRALTALQIVKCVYNAIIATAFVSPQTFAIVGGPGEAVQQSPDER